MSGTTAIAISSAANAQAAAALSKAEDAACRAEMPGFEHNTATVQEMQGYAQCVQRLHPVDFDQEMQAIAWVVLACIIVAFVGCAVAAARGAFDGVLRFTIITIMSAIGLILACFTLMALAHLFSFL